MKSVINYKYVFPQKLISAEESENDKKVEKKFINCLNGQPFQNIENFK